MVGSDFNLPTMIPASIWAKSSLEHFDLNTVTFLGWKRNFFFTEE